MIDIMQEEISIHIVDVSQHGIRFIINKPLLPSNILIVKFNLKPANSSGNLYRNPHKKIYVEVRRVSQRVKDTGVEYDVGALSIDGEKLEELQEISDGIDLINKRLTAKDDLKVLLSFLKDTQCRRIEKILSKQGYVVYTANQNHTAMEMLRKNRCDIAILDNDAARTNEYELLKNVRHEFKHVGLILEVNSIDEWLDLLSYRLNEYLIKGYLERELNIVVETVLRKVLYRNMILRNDRENGKSKNQNILVLSLNETLRNIFCELSRRRESKIYFVIDTENALKVLSGSKIDFVLLDSEIVGENGFDFITKIKKDFPLMGTAVTSKKTEERCSYLLSGVDNFIIEPSDMQKYKEYWDDIISQHVSCL